jgi:uncharacterized membrane protein
MSGLAEAATMITAIGCGLVGGVFFAFSTFVMAALRRLPAAQGIAAMQSINVLAVTPAFMTALFGTAVASLALIGWTATSPDEWPVATVLAGGGLYLVGTVGVTIAANVPLNNRLARLGAESPDAADRWAEYVTSWTRWNHVRTVAALAAAVLLTIALEA